MWPFSKRFWARAKNDAGERIESLRFSVPALRVGVLEYAPGQLQTNNAELDGKPVRLYYPPEAVSDEKFLKTLETAPVVVGGHDSTTNEANKRIDGWAHNVAYDTAQKAAVISGVVKGAKEVAYIRSHVGSAGFGASAFVDIYNLKIESGVTPDGQTYNAIAQELRATHVALTPNVRDPENKIKVLNAVVINSHGEIKNSEEIEMDEKALAALITTTVKNTMEEAAKAKNEDDRISELESAVNLLSEAVKEIKEAMGAKTETGNAEEKKDGEEKKEEEPTTLENAKPSQALVSAFATAYNVDFGAKTPSFSILASLAGITETDAGARIAAVNAKFSTFEKADKKTEKTTIEVF